VLVSKLRGIDIVLLSRLAEREVSSDALARLGGLLACPECGASIALDVARGVSRCAIHGDFRFAGPFPSFVSDEATIFEEHWDRNAGAMLPARKLIEARAFLKPVLSRFPGSQPLHLLDAGCGEGAHVAILSETRDPMPDDILVGLDIAVSALHRAQRRASRAWSFVHGDMMQLPFRSASFDVVFSFGVLALTPDPTRALSEMVRVLRPGGLFGVWVFSGHSALLRAGLRVLRAAARSLGAGGTAALASAMVPLYSLLPTRSGLSIGNASWWQTREVLMSNLTPPHMHFLEEAALRRSLMERGISVLPPEQPDTALTLWGDKR
jgi:SAM-dependent methyltransferase